MNYEEKQIALLMACAVMTAIALIIILAQAFLYI